MAVALFTVTGLTRDGWHRREHSADHCSVAAGLRLRDRGGSALRWAFGVGGGWGADGGGAGLGQAGGSTVNFEIQRIHTTSDLEQALGVNVDASYGCAAFGAGASMRFNFAQTSSVQSSSLFMTITATVGLAFLQIDAPRLTTDAASVVDRPDTFEAR